MLRLVPHDSKEVAFAVSESVKQSGLSVVQICDRLELDFGEKLSPSALSHTIWRGTLRLQRVLRILAVCRVIEIKIESEV